MFKTNVTCWFCNEESQVFFMKKNSWTCEKCEQYNGFKKVYFKNKIMVNFCLIYFFKGRRLQ